MKVALLPISILHSVFDNLTHLLIQEHHLFSSWTFYSHTVLPFALFRIGKQEILIIKFYLH